METLFYPLVETKYLDRGESSMGRARNVELTKRGGNGSKGVKYEQYYPLTGDHYPMKVTAAKPTHGSGNHGLPWP